MEYNKKNKTITIKQKRIKFGHYDNFILKDYVFDIKGLNNMPEDAEILNIEFLVIKNVIFDNLPPTLKEINIKYMWIPNYKIVSYIQEIIKNFVFNVHFFDNKTLKTNLKKIFPKRPYGCKIYLFDSKKNSFN
jgi:hypothetical protein